MFFQFSRVWRPFIIEPNRDRGKEGGPTAVSEKRPVAGLGHMVPCHSALRTVVAVGRRSNKGDDEEQVNAADTLVLPPSEEK